MTKDNITSRIVAKRLSEVSGTQIIANVPEPCVFINNKARMTRAYWQVTKTRFGADVSLVICTASNKMFQHNWARTQVFNTELM